MKELFGPVVTAMWQKCELCKKEGEAFNFCLPRRPGYHGNPFYSSTSQGFAAGRGQHTGTRVFHHAKCSKPTVRVSQQRPTVGGRRSIRPRSTSLVAERSSKHLACPLLGGAQIPPPLLKTYPLGSASFLCVHSQERWKGYFLVSKKVCGGRDAPHSEPKGPQELSEEVHVPYAYTQCAVSLYSSR